MTRERALAAAQTVPHAGDVTANVAEHLRLLELAVSAGVQLLVFPELSLTGYELELAASLAFSADDARLAPLRAFVDAHNVTAVVGAPVQLDEQKHIGAFVLAPGTQAIYTKQHLGAFSAAVNPGGSVPPPEPSLFRPGTQDPLVDFAGRHGALAICADTGRAAHAQAAADRGATLYLAGMFIIPADVDAEHAQLQRYAHGHRMLVLAANYGGPTGGLDAAGRSAIWSPGGALLVELGRSGAGLALAFETETGWQGQALC
jgi:predicted amidohydrolase